MLRHFLKEERLTPELMQFLLQLKADAEACGQSMAEYALRWILCQRGVTSVLVGASSTEQLAKNLRCLL